MLSPVPLPNFGPGTGQVPAAVVACGNEFSAVLAEDSGVSAAASGASAAAADF